MDGLNPSICPNGRYGWTTIGLYAKLGDMDGQLSAYMPN
jgi:hypothetical protein